MTVRGRRLPALPVAMFLLAACDTTVAGSPTSHAMPTPVASTVTTAPTTTTPPATTTTTTTHAPAPHTTRRPVPHTTRVVPRTTAKPPVHEKLVTYLITGSGTVSVRYLAGGSMHSASNISLPWRKTVPLSNGQYELDITTGSDANVDEQVSVEGAVVGTGHNEGAGTGSFTGSY